MSGEKSTMSANIGSLSGAGDGPYSHQTENGKSLRFSPRSTPLKKFVEAKNRINSVFNELQQYVTETTDFLSGLNSDLEFVPTHTGSDCENLRATVKTIREMLDRDHMKVVFFGRTSNGKSTVVNAMLHAKVLPQGLGHTTRCFLQVEGSDSGQKYILAEGSEEPQTIESIDQLGHALCSKEYCEDTLLKVFWPKSNSKLLQNEVVLLDSPGVDVSPEFDSWIDKHCLDADVFVLVTNAESTLTQTEKNFFHRVSSKLSSPNIFVLNNRWDASAAEPEFVERVRQQHMTRFVYFLVDELKACSAEEVKRRVFFVSAREVLQQRLKAKGVSTPTSFLADGYQSRMLEFEDFEEQFETCISKSAMRTKFASHIKKGKEIVSGLYDMLASLHSAANAAKDRSSISHQEMLSELRQSQTLMLQFVNRAKEQIQKLSAEVQLKVSSDFSDEIRRLEPIIDSFSRPFSDEPARLNLYKKDLVQYVDELVTNDLVVRCTGGLIDRILSTEREMIEGVSELLPSEHRTKAPGVMHYRDQFRFSIAIHCNSLVEDFQEDLEFRFSLGITQMIRRFLALRKAASNGEQGQPIFGGALLPRSMSNGELVRNDMVGADEALMHSLIMTSANYVASGGIGLLLVGGLVYRTLGWRVIAIGAAAYLGLYAWERLRWNSRAREQHFKNQLRRHLGQKLRQLSQTVTMNCDSQVTREVQEVLSRLNAVSGQVHKEMKKEVDRHQKDVAELEKLARDLSQTKGKATFIKSELESYETKFLQMESPPR